MDWLDKTLNDHEEKEKQRKAEKEEKNKRFEAGLFQKKQKATIALETIYTRFVEIKKRLKSKKYPCEVNLDGYTDGDSGDQFDKSTVLLVKKQLTAHNAKMSKANSAYISFSHFHGSDHLIMNTDTTESGQPPTEQNVGFEKVTNEYVDTLIESFIKSVFS